MAPLKLRRDIALLGFLHKRVLGRAHPSFATLFPFAPLRTSPIRQHDRTVRARHNKQLDNHFRLIMNQEQLWQRSAFGAVFAYNRLPQDIVDFEDISEFQSALTSHAKALCQTRHAHWWDIYDPRKNCRAEYRYASEL